MKYDGVRLNLTVLREGETYWLSRESKPLPALEWMNSELGNAWTQADWRWFLRQAGYEGVGLMIDGEVLVKGVDFNTSSGLIRTKWLKPSNEEFAECYPGRGKKVQFWIARSRLQVVVYGIIDLNVILDPKAEGPIHSVTRLKAEAIVPLLQKYFPEIDWVLSESHTVYDLESLNSLYEEKRLEGHDTDVPLDTLQGSLKRWLLKKGLALSYKTSHPDRKKETYGDNPILHFLTNAYQYFEGNDGTSFSKDHDIWQLNSLPDKSFYREILRHRKLSL